MRNALDQMSFLYAPQKGIRLEGFSPLCNIIRRAGYHDDFPATHDSYWRLHRDVQIALRADHPEWIYNDRLHVETPNGLKIVTVDMRNTQFIGADQEIEHFRDAYEPDVLACIDAFVPNDGYFFDIGANWGYFSIYLCNRPDFSGKCFAFEPAPRSAKDLVKLVSDLDYISKIEVFAIALGAESGSVQISDELWSGVNSVVEIHEGETSAHRIAQETLDFITNNNCVSRVDLIKLDVEGAEQAVIAGAAGAIKKFMPPIIFENWLSEGGEPQLGPFKALNDIAPEYRFFALELARTQGGDALQGSLRRFEPASERRAMPPRINVLAAPLAMDVEGALFRLEQRLRSR